MRYFQLLLALALVSLSTSSVDDNKIDEEILGFRRELGLVEKEISAETNVLQMFDEEKSPTEIAHILRQKGWTIKKLFTIRKWDGIEERSNLPGLNDFIRDKVDSFHKMDLPIAFRLLGKAGQLLRVAYAGCNGFRCSKVVINVLSKYQDLVSDATTLSNHFVNVCIRSLRYHRYSHYFLSKKENMKKSLKQFKRTIPLATKMSRDSAKVVTKTEDIRELSMTALYQAIDQSKWAKNEKGRIKTKINRYKEMKEDLDVDVAKLKKQADDLSKLAADMRKEEAKVETMRQLESRKSVIARQCNRVTRDVWYQVCNTVSSWWGLVRRTYCRNVRGQVTEVKCRMQIDRLLVQIKNDRLKALSSRLRAFKNSRVQYEEQKLAVQSHQKLLFQELAKTAEQLKRLKDLQRIQNNILDFAVVSLDLAANAMAIVQTQLKKMTDFWDNIIQHTEDLIEQASDETSDDETDDIFKNKLLGSGFSWLSLAKVLRIAAIEMEKTSTTVDDAFTTLPSTDEVKRIINVEGPRLITETLALSRKYEKVMAQTNARITELKKEERLSSKELSKQMAEIEDEEEALDEKYDRLNK